MFLHNSFSHKRLEQNEAFLPHDNFGFWVKNFLPDGAWSRRLPGVVAGPDRIGGDVGQHTPDANRFSRRIHGYAKANGIPVVHCPGGERKHELAEEYLAKSNITQG
jgi:hypothetical protein